MSLIAEEQIAKECSALNTPTLENAMTPAEPVTAATETEYSANETWPVINKPRKPFCPEDIVWDHTVGPMSTLDDIEFLVEAIPEALETPKTTRLGEIFKWFKTTPVGAWGQKVANWIRHNRTEAIAYSVGAAALIHAGYFAVKGTADLHVFETLSNMAYNAVDLKELAPQTTAETSANEHMAKAGIGGMVCGFAFGTGLVARRIAETTTPPCERRIRAYSADRPTEYYFMSTQELRERAEQLRVQTYYLNVLRFLPKPAPTVYYSSSYGAVEPAIMHEQTQLLPVISAREETADEELHELSAPNQAILDKLEEHLTAIQHSLALLSA